MRQPPIRPIPTRWHGSNIDKPPLPRTLTSRSAAERSWERTLRSSMPAYSSSMSLPASTGEAHGRGRSANGVEKRTHSLHIVCLISLRAGPAASLVLGMSGMPPASFSRSVRMSTMTALPCSRRGGKAINKAAWIAAGVGPRDGGTSSSSSRAWHRAGSVTQRPSRSAARPAGCRAAHLRFHGRQGGGGGNVAGIAAQQAHARAQQRRRQVVRCKGEGGRAVRGL